MDSTHRNFIHHETQAFPILRNQQAAFYPTPLHRSSENSSPILIIALLGITVTALLLFSYYVFVIKCWGNRRHIGFLRHFFISPTLPFEDHLMEYDPATEYRGVDESVIRAIPVFRFKTGGSKEDEERSFFECAVCLNEFQDEEKLRILPSCTHVFHIDCIDIWLQSNANCPLCRSSISSKTRFPPNQIIAPASSPQDQTPFTGTLITGDEDFVVIEVRGSGEANADQNPQRLPEVAKSGEISWRCCVNPSPRKLQQKLRQKRQRKFLHGSSMGDEFVDMRYKDEDDQFSVQPIRRSFSMDLSTDRQLFLAVQEIVQQNRAFDRVSIKEDCSSSRVKKCSSFNSAFQIMKPV